MLSPEEKEFLEWYKENYSGGKDPPPCLDFCKDEQILRCRKLDSFKKIGCQRFLEYLDSPVRRGKSR